MYGTCRPTYKISTAKMGGSWLYKGCFHKKGGLKK